MRVLLSLAAGLLVLYLAVAYTSPFGGIRDTGPGTQVGQEARSLSGMDSKGNTIDLAEHRGKIVVVDFWASWCGPCRKKLPEIEKIHAELAGKGVKVIGVNLDEGVSTLRDYESQAGLSFPSIHEGASVAASDFGVSAIPTIIIIDQQGVIRFRGHGGDIRREVEKLL